MTIDDFIAAIRLMQREWEDLEIALSGRAANEVRGGKVWVNVEFEVTGLAPDSAQLNVLLDVLHGRQTKPTESNPTTSGEQTSILDPGVIGEVTEVGGEQDEAAVNF